METFLSNIFFVRLHMHRIIGSPTTYRRRKWCGLAVIANSELTEISVEIRIVLHICENRENISTCRCPSDRLTEREKNESTALIVNIKNSIDLATN